jgi:hypothetical protein
MLQRIALLLLFMAFFSNIFYYINSSNAYLATSSSSSSHNRVTITSPSPSERVSATSLTVSGRSIDNAIDNNCKVSVNVNHKLPYKDVIGTGRGGINDYSSWKITLHPYDSGLKAGPNSITAKYSCSGSPLLSSYYTINVIGSSHIPTYTDHSYTKNPGPAAPTPTAPKQPEPTGPAAPTPPKPPGPSEPTGPAPPVRPPEGPNGGDTER